MNTQHLRGEAKISLENTSEVEHPDDRWILAETSKICKRVTNLLNRYRFDLAAEEIYQFFWHTFCDKYIERVKERESGRVKGVRPEAYPVLLYVLETSLKLLHPFMPFITEQIWQLAKHQSLIINHQPFSKEEALIIAKWPK